MGKKIFDFVIGNPPYQGDRQGASNTALPVYHDFMDGAIECSSTTELITPARFLFNAGRTPKEWNQKMLNDEHFKVLSYENDASKVFPGTDIKGGVAVTYHSDNKKFDPIEVFTMFPEMNSLLGKVKPYLKGGTFSSLGFVATKFNTSNLFLDYPKYDGHERRMSSNVLSFDCFHKDPEEKDVMIYGVLNGKRSKGYINRKYVDLTDKNIALWKIVTPKADGNGAFGDTLTNPEILPPDSGFTHTFLGIGGFDHEGEAVNALKYMKCKLTRALLDVLKVTQDLNAEKWKYVPIQNFATSSDIDWSRSIHDIDLQLYRKYNLDEKEIELIESHVQELA